MTDLDEKLARLKGRKIAVICVGNRHRGDDAFGPLVAEALGEKAFDAGMVPENVLPKVAARSPEYAIFVDAADFSAAPGSLQLFSTDEIAGSDISTHAAPLAVAFKFLEISCGTTCVLLAAQVQKNELGSAPSPEITAAAARAAELLINIF